jgi:hypothetical protein
MVVEAAIEKADFTPSTADMLHRTKILVPLQ